MNVQRIGWAIAMTGWLVGTAGAVQVEKIGVGTGVENRELLGEDTSFPGTSERLYCWTRISVEQPPEQVKHVWSRDGQKEAEVPLEIKSPSGRTWSSKAVRPGAWKVEVMDAAGQVVSTTEFTVGGADAVPAASTTTR